MPMHRRGVTHRTNPHSRVSPRSPPPRPPFQIARFSPALPPGLYVPPACLQGDPGPQARTEITVSAPCQRRAMIRYFSMCRASGLKERGDGRRGRGCCPASACVLRFFVPPQLTFTRRRTARTESVLAPGSLLPRSPRACCACSASPSGRSRAPTCRPSPSP